MTKHNFLQVGAVAVATTLAWSIPALGEERHVEIVAGGGLASTAGVRVVVFDGENQPRPFDTSPVELDAEDYLTCMGADVWCPSIKPKVGQSPVVLPAFNQVSFRATLELPLGESWTGESMLVEGWLHDTENTGDFLRFVEHAEVHDSGSRIEVTWNGPAGILDLRVVADGWMPLYLFDLAAGPGTMRIGAVSLRRGASLTAFAVDTETGIPVSGMRASVRQPGVEHDDPRAKRLRVQGETNDRGFVQLHGIAPGVYDLLIESADRPTTYVRDVELMENQETFLPRVELAAFTRFAVHVDPATDGGEPWRIELMQAHEPWRTATAATDGGTASWKALAGGSYYMTVLGARGDTVLTEQRWVGGDGDLFLKLDLVPVQGRVVLGREGVRAEVDLSTGANDRKSFETDEEGRFSGRFFRPAKELVAALVETDTGIRRVFQVRPRLRGGVYEMTLELGTHQVTGRVLEVATRSPIDGASIDLGASSGGDDLLPHLRTSGADGSFAFRGLDEGTYEVYAYMEGYTQSKPVRVSSADMVDSSGVGDLTILLQAGTETNVLVTSEHGDPHRNAHVSIVTMTPDGIGVGSTRTGLDGRGRVVVPHSVTPASVIVQAPAGALWSGCVNLPDDGTELAVRVPSAGGGTLVLLPSDAAGDAPEGSEQSLLALGGGLVTIQDLFNWMSEQELPFPDGEALTAPRVASGYYGVVETSSLGLAAYPAACQGAIPPVASWEFLPAGGRLELPLRFRIEDESALWLPF
ncbi:MAG: carboxypeptidase regulatory-like domain-containing protein [Acidobacteria bacterium]|nr:carboxypeptidase regulatory-like domain-containing protein [Acidobacteriota bacterium]